MRSQSLITLLKSVESQSYYPDSILIIDGSIDDETKHMVKNRKFKNLNYHKVDARDRGLTRQRNYGIKKVDKETTIVCFLDDDIVLAPDYFEKLVETYTIHPDALGVGGYITNEVVWNKITTTSYVPSIKEYYYDGYKRKDGTRFIARKLLKLDSNIPPGFFPEFGHGRSIGFLPPSNKIYPVENFMGGVASYKKEVFNTIIFSNYFSGYGLYEDADFCFRLNKLGNLYVNTSAKCEHHHASSGRPNFYKYGKMVVRNGWYVWRVKYAKPSFKAKCKWNTLSLLLTTIRFTNIITTRDRTKALSESCGRIVGWFSLWFNPPKIEE